MSDTTAGSAALIFLFFFGTGEEACSLSAAANADLTRSWSLSSKFSTPFTTFSPDAAIS